MPLTSKKIKFRDSITFGSKCVQRIRSKEDLEELQKQVGHVSLLLHSKNCGHCEEDLRDFEQECPKFQGTPIVLARCDLSDKGCEQLWIEAKPKNLPAEEYGYPVKVGLNQNSTIDNPIYFSLGRNPDEMRMIFSKLRRAVGDASAEMHPQQQAPQRVANPYQNFANQYAVDHNSRMQVQKVRSGMPEVSTLCVNCDREDRERRMKAFILGL